MDSAHPINNDGSEIPWQITQRTVDQRCWFTWWRHQMGTFSALLAFCAGNSPVTGEFPSQRPVTRSLMFSLICAWINGWVNNREAGDLRRHCAHYDVNAIRHIYPWRADLFHRKNYDCIFCPFSVLRQRRWLIFLMEEHDLHILHSQYYIVLCPQGIHSYTLLTLCEAGSMGNSTY